MYNSIMNFSMQQFVIIRLIPQRMRINYRKLFIDYCQVWCTWFHGVQSYAELLHRWANFKLESGRSKTTTFLLL